MCRSLEDGGRRCNGVHAGPRIRSTADRSREYFRKRSRTTGEPNPYDQLDAMAERYARMREAGEADLESHHQAMIESGIPEADADRLTLARRDALYDRLLAMMCTDERRWTAATFTKGRGVRARQVAAADAEERAREAALLSRVKAQDAERQILGDRRTA